MTDEHRMSVAEIEQSSSLDEAERAELQNPGYEIFIAALSILSIVNLLLIAFVHDQNLDYVLLAMNGLLSLILFIDFCVRLKSAESRTDYFFRKFGWADLLASVPVAQFKILRVFRLIRVYRLLKEYGARNIWRSLAAERAGSALLSLLLVAILVLEFGSLGMLGIESGRARCEHRHGIGFALVHHRHDVDRGLRRPVPGHRMPGACSGPSSSCSVSASSARSPATSPTCSSPPRARQRARTQATGTRRRRR